MWPLDGWLDEFRFSNGIARWTSNFTPPTSEYSSLAKAPQNHFSFVDYKLPIPQQQSTAQADTVGVFRPGSALWFLKNANGATGANLSFIYGNAGDSIALGTRLMVDFADIVFSFGNSGDMPLAGNWDGIPTQLGMSAINVCIMNPDSSLLAPDLSEGSVTLETPDFTSGCDVYLSPEAALELGISVENDISTISAGSASLPLGPVTITYQYDPLNRLTAADYSDYVSLCPI